MADTLRQNAAPSTKAETKAQLAKLEARENQIVAIDFFGANGREPLDGLLAGLEDSLKEDDMVPKPSEGSPDRLRDLSGRVWVTRRGGHIDRTACAWMIRRFIDKTAAFGLDMSGHPIIAVGA